MNKKITIIGINYYPENTAIGLYTTQLAEYLAKQDVEVTVISGFPYYPSWKINDSYIKKPKYISERINNVTILRYKQYVPKKPTFFKRILLLSDFTIGSFFNLFRIKKTDVVLCIVPFTSSIFLGKILSILKKAKLWVHIQDFEFDAATETNLISGNNNAFKILFKLEKKLLMSADLCSTISQSMLKKLCLKNKKNENKLLPNWVDLSNISPEKTFIHQYLKSHAFKILYSGNIGEKQDWDFFLDFVKEIKKIDNIEIIIVGDGSKKEWLVNKTKKHTFIKHFFPVDYNELSDLLCSTDLHILFQKENVQDTVMPSKILGMMASEKPLLLTGSIESEVYSIIKESNSGKYFQIKDIKEIIAYIVTLKQNKSLIKEYGKNGRKYVSVNYAKKNVLNDFYNTFLKLTN